MFDIGWSEMAIVAVIALFVIGPKELPKALRTFGRYAGKVRAMAREFQASIDEAVRESELDEVKKQIENAGKLNPTKALTDTIDPKGQLREAMDFSKTALSDAADESIDETGPPTAGGKQQPVEGAKSAAASKPLGPPGWTKAAGKHATPAKPVVERSVTASQPGSSTGDEAAPTDRGASQSAPEGGPDNPIETAAPVSAPTSKTGT